MTMTNSDAERLAEGLYEGLLMREPDRGGLAHWTGVGEQRGAVAMLTGFLSGASGELREAREEQAAEMAAKMAVIREDLDELKVMVAGLAAAVDSLQAPPVDEEAIADRVAAELVGRLTS